MLLIKNGKVFTMEGKIFERASILVEDGKIKEIGENIVAPLDAQVIDAEGRIVMPGFIDAHCHLGMWEDSIGFEGADGNEMTDPVTPQLRAIDGINPLDRTFEETRQGGVTCAATGPGSANVIGGQFVAIKTYGDRIDDMIVKEPLAMKCAFGENPKRVYNEKKQSPMTRMATAAILRETLMKAKEYKDKLEAAGEDESKKPALDVKMEAMLKVLNGEIPLKAHAHRADDILTSIRIAKEFGVKLTLEHCTEGHLIAHHIKKEGLPAIVGPSFGERCKFELKNLTFETPGVLSKAGVKVAIMTDHPVIPLQHLGLCAALAVKAGMDEEEALKAITINPAQILGIDDRVGSIKEGKDADIVIWSNHPFEIKSEVLYTIIDGKVVYENKAE
ncbi:amidohydrolase [Paramaledivibacter caminithermalis]|jgi:imidazolonepropionase-like amidohydrolase|uniref:Imidazolonepropionase n=1 Tax=Paramaledivibacter caminithermalis (strain DSM 15212 / CIP 107654 / DViRD3) TaxID=1121301 RepID=A0A1M6L881_PARC5|nr:amidohydrolase [Paramaledivibacter caminithermalis]SHJ67411.1 Imidazolonepropionase [Paramaledivibacter caminithermalis DSM 15212]